MSFSSATQHYRRWESLKVAVGSGAFIADELDDDPSHKAPSTASDIQVEPHRPIVFSSAFSAASRARPAGNPITPRYANQFAAHEALFPFGAGTSGASASTAFGGEQAYGYTGSGGAVESPYDLPGYDLRGTAAAALEGLPPQQEILPMVEEEVALDPALAQTGKKRKGKRPAKSRTKKAASGKSTPARRSRSISEKEEDLAVDPEFETEREQAAEQDAKRKRAASKKKFGRPPLPAVFGAGDAEEEKKALMRGMDPSLAKNLVPTFAAHKTYYQTAYNALNDELIKIQIEESVLRNIKSVVHAEREMIRAMQ